MLGAGAPGTLFWHFGGVAATDGQFQVLDRDLHLTWKTVIILTLGISALCSLRAWRQTGWTMPVAVVNTGANWLSGAVIVALTAKGTLYSRDLPQQVEATFSQLSRMVRDHRGLPHPDGRCRDLEQRQRLLAGSPR